MRRRWLAIVLAAGLMITLGGCGHPAPSARGVLARYLAAWGRGDWTAMRQLAAGQPARLVPVNAAVFRALGVTRASFTAGQLTTADSGRTARARVTEHVDLPAAGAWNPATTVRLTYRGGSWRVAWSPATISPALRAGDTIAVTRAWPPRAPVLGAGGARLTRTVSRVVVGVAGSRIASKSAVRTALLGAGATRAAVGRALAQADFPAVARLYGLQRTPRPGLPAFAASVPRPASPTELAADAMGQGRLTFSPLGMATVAAAIDSGVVRAPRLVAGAPDDRVPAARLPARITAALRQMMISVVTRGTAAGTGLPAGTHAKTGTAEYGTGPEARLKIDGWLMGYDGDIAFAIVTHNTGGPDGGPVDGPIIARFLDALGPGA